MHEFSSAVVVSSTKHVLQQTESGLRRHLIPFSIRSKSIVIVIRTLKDRPVTCLSTIQNIISGPTLTEWIRIRKDTIFVRKFCTNSSFLIKDIILILKFCSDVIFKNEFSSHIESNHHFCRNQNDSVILKARILTFFKNEIDILNRRILKSGKWL